MTALEPRPDAPSFAHDDPGRAESDWLCLDVWESLPPLRPDDAAGRVPERLVVAVAHPDDETLATAGLLTWAADQGVECHVVVATDGEASHPDSPTHAPGALRSIRRRELRAAVRHLHPGASVERLGLPDGEVADTPDAVTEALVDLVTDRTLLVSTWRHDGHPDHEAVARAAADVAGSVGARHLEAPIWLWHWGSVGDVPWRLATVLDLTPAQSVRRARAVASYPSQHEPLSSHPADAAVLGPHVLAHFTRPFETYLEHPRACAGAGGVFERLHRADADPWTLATSWYERRKRAVALAALPREHLGRVLEVGCSVGVLTADLAERAESVLAVDVSSTALAAASRRLEDTAAGSRVRWERRRVPAEWPHGTYDTVVLSEVGYFLTAPQWRRTVEHALRDTAGSAGAVLLVHWRHPVAGWPLDGEQVHRTAREVAQACGFRVATTVVDDDFLLDLLTPDQVPSIATNEGKT